MNILDFIASKEDEILGNQANQDKKWELVEKYIILSASPYERSCLLEQNFYPSAAACPHCNRGMYKTNFSNADYEIKTAIRTVRLHNVFTCPECYTFFAAPERYKISEGILFTVSYDNEYEYTNLLKKMDVIGNI